MTDVLTVRLVQHRTSPGPPDDGTLDRMSDEIRTAGADGVDLVVFPELVTTGYHVFGRLDDDAEPIPGPTTDTLGDAATQAGVQVLFGMPVVEDEGYRNAAVWLTTDGAVEATHLKRYLWGTERDYFTPGEGATVVETDFGRVGIQICYEANFPEASLELARAEVDAIVNISAWSRGMESDWHRLLPTRALENGAYVLGCNLVGGAPGTGTTFCGRSKVVDPDGSVRAELDGTAGQLTVALDHEALTAERDRNPMREDRRALADRSEAER